MGARSAFGGGPRWFSRLGRIVVAHPWHFIIFWIALLVVSAPFLHYLGSVTTNSTTTLPASSPSSLAQQEFEHLFPNETGAAASDLLFTGPNMTDANAQSVLGNVTTALLRDRTLTAIGSIDSVYTDYSAYLAGDVQIAASGLRAALAGPVPLPVAVNGSAALLWGPAATFVAQWEHLGADPAANDPAYQYAQAVYAGSPNATLVLSAFYNGYGSTDAGFNGTLDCAGQPGAVIACANTAVLTNVPPLFSVVLPNDAESQAIGRATLAVLGVQNYTSWPSVRFVAVEVLSGPVGLPPNWLLQVWIEFPDTAPTPSMAAAFANATVARATLWTEPFPVPRSILSEYVSPGRTAQLIVVTFEVPDDFTGPGGSTPVYSDIDAMNSLVPPLLHASDPTRSITFAQTGTSPLDQAQQTVVNSAIELVLPVTVIVLIAITALYFRGPITPLVAFAGLAVALVLGLGGTVLLGTLVTHVDTTSLTLEEVFVLGVGTDYAIFLISRYREELVAGAHPREAVITSVTWAGQSVATSGTTAVIATLALTFSGIALLSQWGMVLSLAVLITILVSLTMIPALLTVIGPRMFWPTTRERFARSAQRARERADPRQGYFYRVAAFTRRRPLVVIAVTLLVSAPLVYVALEVPISYDFYGQLPSNQPAVQGLNELNQHFSTGFAYPTTALVTFASPLLHGNQTNATEFGALAHLTSIAENTSGVATVQSLVGSYGASLSTWQNLSEQATATQAHLEALAASFVGTDQRTVLLTVQTNQSGLSLSAISTLLALESSFGSYAGGHPKVVTQLAYVGGAAVTNDLANQTALATERLFIAVSIALLVVLFVVLRSWIIPLLAVATIGLSIAWAWGLTYLVLGGLFGIPIFFFVPTLMFILILGLGIDYNIFLLSRIREERLRGRSSSDAVAESLARTGGIITAAAIILAGAFGTLLVGNFSLLVAIGFSVAVAVILDAMVVRTYLVPSVLQVLGERVWRLPRRRAPTRAPPPEPGSRGTPESPTEGSS